MNDADIFNEMPGLPAQMLLGSAQLLRGGPIRVMLVLQKQYKT